MRRIRNRALLLVCSTLVVSFLSGCSIAGASDSVAGSWAYNATQGSMTYSWTLVFASDGAWNLAGVVSGGADGTEVLSGSGTSNQDVIAKTIALSGSTALTHGNNPTTYGWLLGLYAYSRSGNTLTLESNSGTLPMTRN